MRVQYNFSSRRTGAARDPSNYLKKKTKFPDAAQKVLDMSDIILHVLDARFIQDTTNNELVEYVTKGKKSIIYVLNKIDLVKNLTNPPTPFAKVSGRERTGIRNLRAKIKMIAGKIKKKKEEKIVVGVLGYPNTGKSTLINLLIGKKSAGTGAEAGYTKGIQKLKMTENVMLLDSPGVIPKEEYSSSENKKITKHTKVGARTYSHIKDPEAVVTELMNDYAKDIETHYNINAKGDTEVLLEILGKQKNFLKKRGEIATEKAAREVLKDWQEGKIKL